MEEKVASKRAVVVDPLVRLHVLSRVGLKVTGTAGVPKWVVGTNCRILRVTGTAGVPIWVTGDKSVEGKGCIWVTGNNPDFIKRTGFAVGNGRKPADELLDIIALSLAIA